jgi:hypothetical protein
MVTSQGNGMPCQGRLTMLPFLGPRIKDSDMRAWIPGVLVVFAFKAQGKGDDLQLKMYRVLLDGRRERRWACYGAFKKAETEEFEGEFSRYS